MESKAYDIDSMDKPLTDTPPPYSARPQPTTAAPVMHDPVMHAPVMHAPVMHAPVMHAPVGVIHQRTIGVVGTNVGVVGTNVGMVGTNIGVVGVNVGQGTTMVPVMMTQQMSPRPMVITCKYCHLDITTRVHSTPTWKTHFFAGLLCLMGCWCCVCIPYFTKSCLNGEHYCPNCNAHIGSYTTYS